MSKLSRRDFKKELNKWQIGWWFGKDFSRLGDGWRTAEFGVFKLTSLPPEGAVLVNRHYKGFIIKWRYWLPFERYN